MSGGAKPTKVKYNPVTSQFNGVNQATFDSDFGTGTSTKREYTDPLTGNKSQELYTNSTLSNPLKIANDSAITGLQNNLAYLNLDPNARYQAAIGGTDPYYNVLAQNTLKNQQTAESNAALAAQRTGNTNSTAYGSALGDINNNTINQRNLDLVTALQYGNQTANQNLATQLGAVGNFANLVYPLGSAANSNLMSAFNQLDAVARGNSDGQYQADVYNAQAQDAYNKAKKQSLGSTIGGGIGAAAAIGLAPFTGGASLLALPAALGSLGSGLGGGSSAGGGGGYIPQSFGTGGGGGSSYYAPALGQVSPYGGGSYWANNASYQNLINPSYLGIS